MALATRSSVPQLTVYCGTAGAVVSMQTSWNRPAKSHLTVSPRVTVRALRSHSYGRPVTTCVLGSAPDGLTTGSVADSATFTGPV